MDTAKRKSNILLIMCDQLRRDCLSDSNVKTPNLDALRADGVTFSNCISQTPVCIPARHSLISGQEAFEIGLCENAGARGEIRYPLPSLVRGAGYSTMAVGKMHFISTREHFGFDRMYLSEEIPAYIQDDDYIPWLRENGYTDIIEPHGARSETYYVPQTSRLPEKFHTTAWTADKTVEVINANKNRPFFVFSSFIKPHPPFDPCVPYDTMYNPAEVSLPLDYDAEPYDNAVTVQNGYKVGGKQNMTEDWLRRMRAHYYGCVTQVDAAVGRIIAYLKESGLYDRTTIIFTSDHGEMLGDHGAFGKRTYYEQSCGIPLIIKRAYEAERGGVSQRLCTLPDVYATILGAAGAPIPETCRGIDLLSCENDAGRMIFAQYGRKRDFKAMLRWENYKYIYIANGRRGILYDLIKDPDEKSPVCSAEIEKFAYSGLVCHFQKLGFGEALDSGSLIGFDYKAPVAGGYLNQYPSWQNRL